MYMVMNRKRINKGFIVLTQGESVGMLTMLVIIAILLAFSVFRPVIPWSKQERMAFHRLDSMLALQDADLGAPARASPENKVRNDVAPSDAGRQRTSSWEGSKKNTFGKATNGGVVKRSAEAAKKPVIVVTDLNLADSTTLLSLPQIGEVMSSRIQRYRERLGGFVAMEQLYEVKGMDTARYETILPYLILGEGEPRKLHVNADDFKVLLRHPYLDYDQVKAIVNHRERRGVITSWKQLQSLLGDCNPLLEHYIDY